MKTTKTVLHTKKLKLDKEQTSSLLGMLNSHDVNDIVIAIKIMNSSDLSDGETVKVLTDLISDSRVTFSLNNEETSIKFEL